uniref:Venom s1 protease with cub domain 3 n=1 Tax=Pristhesancus plagipennis TaxID=1955184 RepID=A0A1Q1NPK9_PRIPG|nr:venom s1 protease with cub domain 3 [Pristhesancus plagipennis]
MLALLLLLVAVSARETPIVKEEQVQLSKGDNKAIESPAYPDIPPAGTKLTWYLSSEPGTTMLLTCEDLRISPSENCKNGYFLVFDGNREDKFCGSESGLTVKSVKNQMKIEFDVNWSSGVAKCQVIVKSENVDNGKPNDAQDSADQTEEVKLELGGEAYDKIWFRKIRPNKKITWKFVTSPDARITFYCTHIYLGSTCQDGSLTTSGGANLQKICGTRANTLVDKSISNTFSVTLKSGRFSQASINCLVQAVNGERTHQFLNLKSEEIDSSEFGQGVGDKKTTCECGFSRKSPARIVNGDNVEEGQYPWIVALKYQNQHWCGGSIITEEHILTAAHCTVNRLPEHFKVITGTINNTYTHHGQILTVKKIFEHEYVAGQLHLNDVAVMWLNEKIKFSPRVGRICLTPNKLPITNQYITVMGWGNLGEKAGWRSPQIMKRAHVRVMDYNTCSFLWYRTFDTSKVDRVCVWAANRTACYGDSGGPLVWHDPETKRYIQVALVSFGRGCGFDAPQVNTNVAHFYPWILKIISESSPQETCIKE